MVVMMRNLSLPSFLSLQFYILSILMYLYSIITKQFNLQFNQFKPLLDILYIFTENILILIKTRYSVLLHSIFIKWKVKEQAWAE